MFARRRTLSILRRGGSILNSHMLLRRRFLSSVVCNTQKNRRNTTFLGKSKDTAFGRLDPVYTDSDKDLAKEYCKLFNWDVEKSSFNNKRKKDLYNFVTYGSQNEKKLIRHNITDQLVNSYFISAITGCSMGGLFFNDYPRPAAYFLLLLCIYGPIAVPGIYYFTSSKMRYLRSRKNIRNAVLYHKELKKLKCREKAQSTDFNS